MLVGHAQVLHVTPIGALQWTLRLLLQRLQPRSHGVLPLHRQLHVPLQVAETLETDLAGEAHDRRLTDAGLLADLAYGQEGELLEAALQPLGDSPLGAGQGILLLLETGP